MESRVFVSGGNTYSENITYSANLIDGGWHHAAAVYESPSSRKFYVDGSLVGTSTDVLDNISSSNNLRFSAGSREGNVSIDYYTGDLDDVRFYASSLTADEISDASEGYDCSNANRILKWSFDDQPNTIVEDQFNNYNGEFLGTGTPTSNQSSLSIGELKANIISTPANGTATFTDDFEITYVPDAGFTGPDQLTYQLQNGDCETSDGHC